MLDRCCMCQMWIHLKQLILVHDLKLLNVNLLENMDRKHLSKHSVNVFSSVILLFFNYYSLE